jgi:hypothetical protein
MKRILANVFAAGALIAPAICSAEIEGTMAQGIKGQEICMGEKRGQIYLFFERVRSADPTGQ